MRGVLRAHDGAVCPHRIYRTGWVMAVALAAPQPPRSSLSTREHSALDRMPDAPRAEARLFLRVSMAMPHLESSYSKAKTLQKPLNKRHRHGVERRQLALRSEHG